VKGRANITYGLTSKQREKALLVYTLFVVFQGLGLCLSHYIVIYKNEIKEKALQLKLKTKVALSRNTRFAFFISHHQGSGGDQCNTIVLELEKLGFPCWYDQTASQIDKQAMAKGVHSSECFLLFLSSNSDGTGTLGRPFVQFEIREALKANKKIILVHETDDRHGLVSHASPADHASSLSAALATARAPVMLYEVCWCVLPNTCMFFCFQFDFAVGQRECPEDLQFLLEDNEAIPWRRRAWERENVLRMIIERTGNEKFIRFHRSNNKILKKMERGRRSSFAELVVGTPEQPVSEWASSAHTIAQIYAYIFTANSYIVHTTCCVRFEHNHQMPV
jgi:hypothetical protein